MSDPDLMKALRHQAAKGNRVASIMLDHYRSTEAQSIRTDGWNAALAVVEREAAHWRQLRQERAGRGQQRAAADAEVAAEALQQLLKTMRRVTP